MLLLDTHVWIWATVEHGSRTGPKTRRLLDRAASRDQLRVSVVSAFEVSSLCAAGRMSFTLPATEWIEAGLALPGVRLAELTRVIAVDAGQIPRSALADPFDRLLAATARRLDASLVTVDRALLEFAKATGLKAVNAAQ